MAQLKEGSVIKKSTGDEVIATETQLNNHNTDVAAHNDIRQQINTLDADVVAHKADAVKHITSAERTAWNNKAEISDIPTKVGQLENDKLYVTQAELGSAGYGDMTKGIYDTNNNGIVDNAEKVNGFTVEANVPANAKFTDTIYTHPSTHSANMIVENTTKRFVSDTEKNTWNGKQDSLGFIPVDKSGDTMTGSLAVETSVFPVVDIVRNTTAPGNVYGGAKLERTTTATPANGIGVGFYFKAPNANKASTFAGLFGGALGTVTAGSEKGEIILSPSYAGQDPYTRKDLVVRAISSSKAEAELNGKLYTDQTLANDASNTVVTKNYVDANKGNKIVISTTQPSNMAVGDVWIQTI